MKLLAARSATRRPVRTLPVKQTASELSITASPVAPAPMA